MAILKKIQISLFCFLGASILNANTLYYTKGNNILGKFNQTDTIEKGYLVGENLNSKIIVLYSKNKPNVIIKNSNEKPIYIKDSAYLIEVYNNIVVKKNKIYPKDNNPFDGLGCIYSPYNIAKQYKCFYNIKQYSGQLEVKNKKIKKICEKHTETCLVSYKKDADNFIKKIIITKKDK